MYDLYSTLNHSRAWK